MKLNKFYLAYLKRTRVESFLDINISLAFEDNASTKIKLECKKRN